MTTIRHRCVGPCLPSVGVLSWVIKGQIIKASSSTMRSSWWAGTSTVMSWWPRRRHNWYTRTTPGDADTAGVGR